MTLKSKRRKRWFLFLPVALLIVLPGCQSLGFYGQAIKGQCQIYFRERPIKTALADPAVSTETKEKLAMQIKGTPDVGMEIQPAGRAIQVAPRSTNNMIFAGIIGLVLGICFASVPLVAGFAILRYRLYEIDIVVNRTLVYATITVILAAAFTGTVLLLGTGLGRGSRWATASATLVVALAFRPLRARVQDVVDRRFNRARYDALQQMGTFLEDLRAGRAAPEAIEGTLRRIVSDVEFT